jgi:hypothetical protein
MYGSEHLCEWSVLGNISQHAGVFRSREFMPLVCGVERLLRHVGREVSQRRIWSNTLFCFCQLVDYMCGCVL